MKPLSYSQMRNHFIPLIPMVFLWLLKMDGLLDQLQKLDCRGNKIEARK